MATHGKPVFPPNIGAMDHDEFLHWLGEQTFLPKWNKDEFFEPLRELQYDGKMFCSIDVPESKYSHDNCLRVLRTQDTPRRWDMFNWVHLQALKKTLVGLFPEFGRTEQNPIIQEKHSGTVLALFTAARNAPKMVDEYTKFEILNLPFFAPKELRPQRFHFVDEDTFQYYGREAFRRLAHMGSLMNTSTNRKLYLHGTMGTGKSHILAAYAAYLVADQKRVVFLADCRLVAVRPRSTIRNALMLAFSDAADILEKTKAIKTDDELENFCDEIAPDHTIYWLIDQANALDPADPMEDRISNNQKEYTRDILDSITTNHIKIQSGSGNYGHGLGGMLRESSEDLMSFSGGFRRTEMDRWWGSSEFGSKWSDLLGEDGRTEIEEFTGCSPMLLAVVGKADPGKVPKAESSDRETVALEEGEEPRSDVRLGTPADAVGKAGETDPVGHEDSVKPDDAATGAKNYLLELIQDSRQLRTMAQMVHVFSVKMRERVTNTVEETDYTTAIDNCLTRGLIDVSAQSLFDHRFQYREGRRGNIAGGIAIAREISRILRVAQAGALFMGVRWFDSLVPGLNRPVLGFVIEQMSLSHIAVYGLKVIDMPTGCASTTFLGDSLPLQFHREQFAIPVVFNYANVDAIYWRRLDGDGDAKPRILIVGIQHTLQQWSKHSSAEHPFFHRARNWLDALNWEGEFAMVWIVEKRFVNDQAICEIEEETEEDYARRVAKATSKRKAKEALKRAAKEQERASLTSSEAGPSTRPDKGKGKATIRAPSPPADDEENDVEPVIASRTPAFTRYVVEIREFSDRIARKLATVRGETYKPAALESPKTKIGKGKKPARRAPPKNPPKPPGEHKGKGDKGDDEDGDDGDDGKPAAAQRTRGRGTQQAVPTEQDHSDGDDGTEDGDDVSEEGEGYSEYEDPSTKKKKPRSKAKAKNSAASPQKRPRPDDDDDAGPSTKKPKTAAKASDARQTRGTARKQEVN